MQIHVLSTLLDLLQALFLMVLNRLRLLTAITLLNLLRALFLMVLNRLRLLTMNNLHLSLIQVMMAISDQVTPGASLAPTSESWELTTSMILTIPKTTLPTPMTMAMLAMPVIQMLVYDNAQA